MVGPIEPEPRHLVAPYDASNSSVRVRGLHWVDRLTRSGRLDAGTVVVHTPDRPRSPVPGGVPVLVLRNVRRVSRGRRETRLLRAGAPGVYDLDDGLPWDDGALPDLGRWWKRAVPRSLIATRSARAADRVVVGNEVLADWAAGHCADVRIVPTCVEPSEYRVRAGWELGERPVIGWIGSPATERYLTGLTDALVEVHRRTGARLVVVSGDGHLPAPLSAFTTRVAWRPGIETTIADWDVGIMPLRDGVYERAKCGYKLLQYAASGVPAVGSPVGVNRRLLADMDGIAATTSDEWIDALVQLLDEPAERRARRGSRGAAVARAHSYEVWEDRWVEAVGW